MKTIRIDYFKYKGGDGIIFQLHRKDKASGFGKKEIAHVFLYFPAAIPSVGKLGEATLLAIARILIGRLVGIREIRFRRGSTRKTTDRLIRR